MVSVYRLDPHDAKMGVLTPFLAQRIERYAAEYQPEWVPAEYADRIMAKLWAAAPFVCALGIVDPDSAKLLGHAVAELSMHHSKKCVEVTQLQADQNVGDARFQALAHILGWAKELGIAEVYVDSHRDGKELEAKLGFKRMRTVHRWVPTVEPSAPPER